MKTRNLALLSDLHIDRNGFGNLEMIALKNVLSAAAITDVHIAGDLSNDWKGLSASFLEDLSADGFSVTATLGNHDMLGLTESEIQAEDFQVHGIGHSILLAFNGWYDYSFYQDLSADDTSIQHFKNNFYFDRKILRADNDKVTTDKTLLRLTEILSQLTAHFPADKIIVALHFVPEQSFILNTRYEKFARFNAFLGAARFHDIFKTFHIKNVVFGHIHQRFQPRTIDGVTYQARPLGYVYEWQLTRNFQPDFLPPRKHYNAIKHLPDWPTYRDHHFPEELKQSLVIFRDL